MVEKYVNNLGVNEGRIVLHSDLNNFFASVECKARPDLKDFPVAVCGSREDRHGIVLAKNEIAKRYGVKTAEAIWQAKEKCPHLVILPPHYDEYVRYSSIVKKIYSDYSDRVESFGIDEAWIELTGDSRIKTLLDGEKTANDIRERLKRETGLTVSVGVSDNKVFSKLASDYRKPDAVTVFGPHNYNDIVGKIRIGEILFVGKSTESKLHLYGLNTIADVASSSEMFMKALLGKNGEKLYFDSCGANTEKVKRINEQDLAKSVGNSVTMPHDLENEQQVRDVFFALAEKVSYRLRLSGCLCMSVSISVRSTNLLTTERQMSLRATSNASEIASCAMKLYRENYDIRKPCRSLGIRTSNLVHKSYGVQTYMFDKGGQKSEKLSKMNEAMDEIRMKYGANSITYVSAMKNKAVRQNATGFAIRMG